MRAIFVICALSFSGFAQETSDNQETTYFFIRHAEKELGDPTNRNPNLTETGRNRAENWSKVFADTTIDFVYSTDYLRTQQTAAPIAKSKKLVITSYDPRNLYDQEFRSKTKGKTSIIVGHSNSTPAFVNKILEQKKYTSIDEKEHGKLFIIKIVGDTITDTVLTIN
ncbi:histidine phosphatase family protein [Aquimarina sp. RZ0]|nr:histidine phosphatase family protein [Aquimarina sp. RZ0]